MSFRIGALALPLVALTAACTATPAPTTPGAASPPALAPISAAVVSEELTERTFRYFWAQQSFLIDRRDGVCTDRLWHRGRARLCYARRSGAPHARLPAFLLDRPAGARGGWKHRL